MCNCNYSFNCVLAAIVSSVVLGVVTAFLQIAGEFTAGTAFLWVALGVGVVYLLGLVAASTIRRGTERALCLCRTLGTLLVGVLGTILLSLVLLAVGVVATSVLSAVLVGLLVFFLWLTLAASACYVRCVDECN